MIDKFSIYKGEDMMKIVGDSIQEGIPMPDEPKEIKYEPKIVVHTIDGKEIMVPITEEFELKKGDFFFKSQEDGKWYLRKEKQMNEEEAIERCKELIKLEHSNWIGISNQVAIEIVLNLIGKQNKVIDEILKYIKAIINNSGSVETIKQYFIRKVEENDKN